MVVLGAEDGLQSMLVAQMLSIHKLQQAALLAKLQGIGGQKITVERVEVHQGGQAIVGNINRGMDNNEKK